MGRKNSSVPIDSDIIEKLIKEQTQSKASIAKQIGYSREAVTRAINKGVMDVGMLDKIAEVLNRYPAFLQGKYSHEYGYADYSFDKKWAIRTDLFKKFIDSCIEEITVRDIDLPSSLRDKPHDYSLADYIEEYNKGLKDTPVIYDSDGQQLSEDAYGYLCFQVIDYLHKFIAEIFIEDSIDR